MKKSGCTRTGRLFKPHGVKGELSASFDLSWISGKNFQKQKFLFIEIYPGDDLVPFFIDWVETDLQGNGRIKFLDFDSLEAIQELVNKEMFLPSDLLTPKKQDNSPFETPVGYFVMEETKGLLGTVKEIMMGRTQQTLVIQNDEKEILVPFVPEFVLKTDKKKRTIYLRLPEGLADLNH